MKLNSKSVAFVPTPIKHIRCMLDMVEINEGDVLYDLGSGDGRILLLALEENKVKKAVGLELDPFYVAKSRKLLENYESATIKNEDLFDTNLNEATIITLYLSKEYNKILKTKLKKLTNIKVVTYSFPIDGWIPLKIKEIGNKKIYLYNLGEET